MIDHPENIYDCDTSPETHFSPHATWYLAASRRHILITLKKATRKTIQLNSFTRYIYMKIKWNITDIKPTYDIIFYEIVWNSILITKSHRDANKPVPLHLQLQRMRLRDWKQRSKCKRIAHRTYLKRSSEIKFCTNLISSRSKLTRRVNYEIRYTVKKARWNDKFNWRYAAAGIPFALFSISGFLDPD